MPGVNTRAKAVVVSIGVVVAVGAVTAAVTVGAIAGIRHFNQPSTTTTSHVASESDPAATVGAPTAEECTQIRDRQTEGLYEWIAERALDRAASDAQSTTTSSLDGEPTEPARVFSEADNELIDACYRATEDACAALSEFVAAELAPTRDAIATCGAACETYRAGACTPACNWGLFGFGDPFDDDAPGGCTDLVSPICDSTNDWRLSHDSASLEHPWDRPPPGWVPPTPECVPICDIDRDGFATARDYAGECAEVAAWLAHDCETQSAGLRALGAPPVSDEAYEKYSEMLGRLLALCRDADLTGMATLPPTLWQSALILHQPSASVTDVPPRPEPPNIDLLTRYRCAGRLTDPCIDYSR